MHPCPNAALRRREVHPRKQRPSRVIQAETSTIARKKARNGSWPYHRPFFQPSISIHLSSSVHQHPIEASTIYHIHFLNLSQTYFPLQTTDPSEISIMSVHPTTLKTYASRVALHSNPTAKRILETMERKQSNLCVSVDVTKAEDALEVVRRVGQSVCMVKVCFDVIPQRPACACSARLTWSSCGNHSR